MTHTIPKFAERLFPWILFSGPEAGRSVYLTFDDGPHPEHTPRVLRILERHRAPAAFFCVGENARRHPGLVREIAERGQGLGGHGWSHRVLAFRPRKTIVQELRASKEVLEDLTGLPVRLFRPPHGRFDLRFRSIMDETGQILVLWHLLPGDYRPFRPGDLVRRVSGPVAPGSIITLHDGHANTPAMLNELEALILLLKDRGFHPAVLNPPVPEDRP